MTTDPHNASNWWELGSPNYNPLRTEGFIRRMQSLIERDMPGKDFDALVVGVHYRDDNTTLMRYGPDEGDAEENDGVEDWFYRLEGDGFKIELFEYWTVAEKRSSWELDVLEGADKAERWLRMPPEKKGMGYK
jgi:hypothetical protein